MHAPVVAPKSKYGLQAGVCVRDTGGCGGVGCAVLCCAGINPKIRSSLIAGLGVTMCTC
jgi:hypothetical protein